MEMLLQRKKEGGPSHNVCALSGFRSYMLHRTAPSFDRRQEAAAEEEEKQTHKNVI